MTILDRIHEVADVHRDKHFVFTSGDHGEDYVNYRALAEEQHQELLSNACLSLIKTILEELPLDTAKPILVVGPETLGALMARQIYTISKRQLRLNPSIGTFRKVPGSGKHFIWELKPEKLSPHTQVIWVDDLLNASSTFRATEPLITEIGARVSAIGVIGDRSGLKPRDLGVKLTVSLEQFAPKRYPADECPLCARHEPIVRRPGHGYAFEKQHPNYQGGFVDV